MKAYIRDEHEKKGHFNGHKYRLTIAMPVSNQVKTIRRCLDSLVPLLKAVPSELIITDTGSTDGTVEIAREYTDHIENFPWCDDMSAARNVGLKAAQGEWFMSIDDDEWFDDVNEIIEFFNSGECDAYGSASYNQRNYSKVGDDFYVDFPTPRITRIFNDVHFEGRIHDTLVNRRVPLKMLNSYVNHYGFAYANEEEHIKKVNRNLKGLLVDNAEFPNDLRYIYQIIKEYYGIGKNNTAIEWCLKGLDIEKTHPDRIRRFEFLGLLIKSYYADKQYQLVIDTSKRFFQEDNEVDTYHMDVYWICVLAYMGLQQYEDAIQSGLAYLDTYTQFKAGQLNNEILLFGGCDSGTPQVYMETLINIVKCYLHEKDSNRAKMYFDKLDIMLVPNCLSEIISIGFVIAENGEQFDLLVSLYKNILQLHDEAKKENFIHHAEIYMKRNSDSRLKIITLFAQQKDNDSYIYLNKLRFAYQNEDYDGVDRLVNWFSYQFTAWNAYYSDVLYIALKYKLDMMPFLDLIDVDDLHFYITQMNSDFPDFLNVIKDSIITNPLNNTIKGLYWSICLCEPAVLASAADDKYDGTLFRSYALAIDAYAHNVYQTELFTDQNILILPRVYRFGHYMQIAFSAKDDGDDVEYIRNLKVALHHYPVMKTPIQKLLEDVETRTSMYELQNNEFADLTKTVKVQIEQFLSHEKYEQAAIVIDQLAELLPNDEDVKRYRLQIQTAHVPNE